jgi:hypothetical protein
MVRKTQLNQNGQLHNILSKMALWSSWTWRQKKHMGGFFDQKFWPKMS